MKWLRKNRFALVCTVMTGLICLTVILNGCAATRPVSMSPAYKIQVVSAIRVISLLEERFQKTQDQEICIKAMAEAKKTLQQLLDASMVGGMAWER